MELTETQKRLYDYLAERIARDGRAPSLREAAADMGVSHNAVAQLLGQLEKKGMVERGGRYSRAIRLVAGPACRRQPDRSRELPIIGQITAGLPMYAQQEWDGSVLVDRRLFPGDSLFCLRIRGESMRGAGILHGDLAVCEPRQYAANGEIVAVLIQGEEATVKRFFLQADHIELRPENPEFPVMRYPFGEVLVQGKVIGVIRGPGGIFETGKRVA
ncbi:MAG: repressor LexA [Leptonema illini]|uniref:LexA repressor n=1 Tax=Leptonema illini TaxID=183 RepID=A0A833GWJ6_9LEPT|nr:MAG: repressor LexA [Leptonema illini]